MSTGAAEYGAEALVFTKDDKKTVFQRQYDFERDWLDQETWRIRMNKYWHYSVYACIIYIIVIFGIQRLMRDRPKFHLRGPLVAWNLCLTVFSMFGAVRCTLDRVISIKEDGFYVSACDSKFYYPESGSSMSFWCVVFVLSKIPELGDTLFIVLRKQKLIFLHWYHHATVLVYCVLCNAELASPSLWFLTMNLVVHAFMYLYYAIRAAGYRLPKPICMSITVLQITQMIFGCGILIYSYVMKSWGYRCDISYVNLAYGGLMYLSYFALFAKFFYDVYMRKRDGNKKVQKTE